MGADDEFVELYNPTGAAVNIGGWLIKKSSCMRHRLFQLLVTIYFRHHPSTRPALPARRQRSPTPASPTRTRPSHPALPITAAWPWLIPAGTVIDQVGMCAGTYYHEGNILQPLPGTSDQSYERKPGGDTACYDTNDNASDFALISPANPQNQEQRRCDVRRGDIVQPHAHAHALHSRARPPWLPLPSPAVLVLNEFLPHPHSDWNSDGTANVGDEYIEIINLVPIAINVKNWKLDTGTGSSKTFTLPDMTLQPRQIALLLWLPDRPLPERWRRHGAPAETGWEYCGCLYLSGGGAGRPDLVPSPGRDGDVGFRLPPSPGRPNIFLNTSTPGAHAGRLIHLPARKYHPASDDSGRMWQLWLRDCEQSRRKVILAAKPLEMGCVRGIKNPRVRQSWGFLGD